jgi:hypothetical protein
MLGEKDEGFLPEVLSSSRDAGVGLASAIAETDGPTAGWPVETARRYLTEYMDYRLTDRHRQGMDAFLRKAVERDLLTPCAEGTTREGAA